LGIDTGVTEFIFNHGDFQAVFFLEQMPQQGGLACPEKATQNGNGDGLRNTHADSCLQIEL
jgi:hypothetical protein